MTIVSCCHGIRRTAHICPAKREQANDVHTHEYLIIRVHICLLYTHTHWLESIFRNLHLKTVSSRIKCAILFHRERASERAHAHCSCMHVKVYWQHLCEINQNTERVRDQNRSKGVQAHYAKTKSDSSLMCRVPHATPYANIANALPIHCHGAKWRNALNSIACGGIRGSGDCRTNRTTMRLM